MQIPKRPSRPWHWCVLFLLTSVATAWMFYPDATTEVGFVSGTVADLSREPAIVADSLSLLADHYKERLLMFRQKSETVCRGKRQLIFGHNVNINNETLLDHVFHECGGTTWLNAAIIEQGTNMIRCKEEYAGIYKERVQPKTVTLRAINVETWTTVRRKSRDAKQACTWLHAIDILNRKW